MRFDDDSRLYRWLRLVQVERHEVVGVVVAFVLYFCVFAGYFAVRPVRETVGTILGASAVSDLFVITWIASIAIVPAYGAICGRFRRRDFLPWIYGFVALCLGLCGLALLQNPDNTTVGAFFYVLISVLNLFIVSVFWSFLLEMFNSKQAQRLFGVIAAGGTLGALTGPIFTGLLVHKIGNAGVLFFGSLMFAVAIACQRLLLRIWVESKPIAAGPTPADRPLGGNPFAGVSMVLKSPYLLGITAYVTLLAAVNTFLYFEQLQLVKETFVTPAERTQAFSQLDAIVQALTILCQILLTGRLAAKWGVMILLTVVPLAMIGGFLALFASPTFAVLAVVFVARRVGEYALVRPGREMLFSDLETATKYKAKNLIDVPVYRGGDALVAKLTTLLGGTSWSPALLGAVVATVWGGVGWWLSRRYRSSPSRAPVVDPPRSD